MTKLAIHTGTDGKNDVEGTVECNEIMTDDIADGDYDVSVWGVRNHSASSSH